MCHVSMDTIFYDLSGHQLLRSEVKKIPFLVLGFSLGFGQKLLKVFESIASALDVENMALVE